MATTNSLFIQKQNIYIVVLKGSKGIFDWALFMRLNKYLAVFNVFPLKNGWGWYSVSLYQMIATDF